LEKLSLKNLKILDLLYKALSSRTMAKIAEETNQKEKEQQSENGSNGDK